MAKKKSRPPKADPNIVFPAGALPAQDLRAIAAGSLAFPHRMPSARSRREWEKRAAQIRHRALLSAGLLPEPERTPLRAKVFGRSKHAGYSVEKVLFESYPGFLCTGNLFRPLEGKGPFPGGLCPHGHFRKGRLDPGNDEKGRWPVLARSATLARLGFVVLAYDMVGYNDSFQVKHRPPHEFDEKSALWGVTPFGLQLWNGVRALDFLAALSDVDGERLGCTGTSGGGTQTYMLACIDPRVKCAVPVCMCSAHFQGGCVCENGPQLRLDRMNNVEVVASLAPRPVLMVSCTGDWTSHSPVAEYPAVREIYRLYGAAEMVALAHFDALHNYNRSSREAMYAWFMRHLKDDRGVGERLREPSFEAPAERELLVFAGRTRPRGLPRGRKAVERIVDVHRRQLAKALPRSTAGLQEFGEIFTTAWREALAADVPSGDDLAVNVHIAPRGRREQGFTAARRVFRRRGVGDGVPAVWLVPEGAVRNSPVTLVVSPEGKRTLFSRDGRRPSPLARALLAAGQRVLAIDTFLTGEMEPLRPVAEQVRRTMHYFTYNRSTLANRIQDILSAAAVALRFERARRINLVGLGLAGVWALLARPLLPAAGVTVADMAKLDLESDDLWARKLYLPLIRRVGDVKTAIALTAPGALHLHNLHRNFPARWARTVYTAAGAKARLELQKKAMTPGQIAAIVGSR